MVLFQIHAASTVMLGDRPDTDIAGAARLGLWTALVRTGRFASGAAWPVDVPIPDWDCTDLAGVMSAWTRDCPGLLSEGIESR